MSWNGDNRVVIQLELTPDDELVARNSVNGDELALRPVDYLHRPERVYSVQQVLDAVHRELVALIVDQDDGVSERYT